MQSVKVHYFGDDVVVTTMNDMLVDVRMDEISSMKIIRVRVLKKLFCYFLKSSPKSLFCFSARYEYFRKLKPAYIKTTTLKLSI